MRDWTHRAIVRVILFALAFAISASAAERINQEGRILGPAPTVTTPTLFNTSQADAIVSAMQIFPVTSAWNEDISGRPRLSNSDAMIAQIIADLGSNTTLRTFYEMNYVLVPDNQAKMDMRLLDYPDESDDIKAGTTDIASFPFPSNLPVETWPQGTGSLTLTQWQQDINNNGGDRHSITVMPTAGFVWETWQTRLTTNTPAWEASNDAKFDLKSNTMRPAGWTSGDAGGLCMFPALVRYDECERGMVEHAMRIVVKRSRQEYIYPATHWASSTPATQVNVPAMGQRVRLKSSFVIPASWTKQEKAVALALKKYGAIVADNGNFFSISVCPDNRFPPNCWSNINSLSINNFEVIQTTGATQGPRSAGAPTANAGADQTVSLATGATLSGSATGTGITTTWYVYPYSTPPGTVTFGNSAALNTTATFSAAGTYTLMLSVSDGVHAVAYDAVIITVSSAPPTPTLNFSAATSSGSEATTSVSIPVSLSPAATQTVTVNYAVTGGTATGGGTDYTLTSGTLTFNAGVTSQTIALTVNSDTLDEPDETIQITLSNPTNAPLGSTTVHTYTITDDDATPTVAFNASNSNGAESATSVSIPVSLSAASGQTVTVAYAVTGGTATGGGTDYTLANGTLTFTAGTTTQNISLTVVNDTRDEPNETVQITLSSPTNATLGTNTVHTYTINDDDPTPTVAFNAATSSGAESATSVSIPVSLSAASGMTVTVAYAVTGGTATGGGTDYTLASGTLTFAAGTTTQNISLSVNNDALDENDETVQITLSSPTNATLGTNTVHTYTIQDNDNPPTVAFSSASSSGAESVTSVSIPVTLSAASSFAVSVNYAVSGGTATGGGTDYTLASGTLNFSAGTTAQNISLSVNNDALVESNETIAITLSSPTNATLGTNTTHTYTILDNDSPPTVAFSAATSSGAENVAAVSIPVALSAPANAAVSVNYSVTGGTATGGGTDYTLANGTLNFAIGDTTKNISLAIVNDLVNEADETIVITLSSPTNATLGAQTSHTHTITNTFTPVITWNNPADIKYPTALSATQLNATTTVPGTFVYTPPIGTVLKAGNGHVLSVQFTPTDTSANNTPPPKTVTINVIKGKANLSLGNLAQNFDGTPKSASATTTPAGLTVSFTYNGSTTPPSAVGSYAVVATVNDADYDGSASGTLVIADAPSGPSIDSAPSSTANPATVGQSVQFTIGVSSPPPLTFQWNFGDGTSAFGGSSANHVYNTTGNFTVTVTVTDGNGQSSTASMALTVANPGGGGGSSTADSDGDGVSDSDEILVGTNPFNAASVKKSPMTVLKFGASFKFGVEGKDTISVSGIIPGLPALFSPKDRLVTLDVSGARVQFTLDAKGRAKSDAGTLSLKMKGKRNKTTKQFEFAGGDAPFKVSLRKGTFSGNWRGIGVNPGQIAIQNPLNMIVDLALGGTLYTATVPALYNAKAGKGGAIKK